MILCDRLKSSIEGIFLHSDKRYFWQSPSSSPCPQPLLLKFVNSLFIDSSDTPVPILACGRIRCTKLNRGVIGVILLDQTSLKAVSFEFSKPSLLYNVCCEP